MRWCEVLVRWHSKTRGKLKAPIPIRFQIIPSNQETAGGKWSFRNQHRRDSPTIIIIGATPGDPYCGRNGETGPRHNTPKLPYQSLSAYGAD